MKISKKLWISALVIWLAVIVLKLIPDVFLGNVFYALDGYETKTFSSDAIAEELLPGFVAKKDDFGFNFKKINFNQESTYGMIYLCKAPEIENFRPCVVGRYKEKPNSCTMLNLNIDGVNNTFISCAKDEISVVMHVFDKTETGCRNLYAQANLLSEKYTGKQFPSCSHLKEEGDSSGPNILDGLA